MMPLLKRLLILVFSSLLAMYSQVVLSIDKSPTAIEELSGEALHIKLVETALKYDFYNKRCRGVSVAGESYRVERLFLQKYGFTTHNFIKKYIDSDTRGYKEKLKQATYQQISKMGGCEAAKDKGLLKEFQQNSQTLYDKAENSPWFPADY